MFELCLKFETGVKFEAYHPVDPVDPVDPVKYFQHFSKYFF